MPHTNPTRLFESAVVALRNEDWPGLARLCDPVSLRAFRRQTVEHIAPAIAHVPLTAEALMKHSPDMPRAAAEYQVAQHQQYANPERRLRSEFPTVASVEALVSLEPLELFAAWLEGRSPRRQIAAIIGAGHAPPEFAEQAASMSQVMFDYVVLGAVSDGDDVSHVIYRQRVDEQEVWTGEAAKELERLPADEQQLMRESWARGLPRTARCRLQEDGTWRLHADHSLLSVGNMSIGGIGNGPPGDISESAS
jgi:hypothetical protein